MTITTFNKDCSSALKYLIYVWHLLEAGDETYESTTVVETNDSPQLITPPVLKTTDFIAPEGSTTLQVYWDPPEFNDPEDGHVKWVLPNYTSINMLVNMLTVKSGYEKLNGTMKIFSL